MPTIGPSLLFAAGLVLGVGTGALIPRPSKEGKQVQSPVQLPPAPPSGERREVGPIRTPAGGVVLQGGFPGERWSQADMEVGHEWYDMGLD
jgi:endonuclease G